MLGGAPDGMSRPAGLLGCLTNSKSIVMSTSIGNSSTRYSGTLILLFPLMRILRRKKLALGVTRCETSRKLVFCMLLSVGRSSAEGNRLEMARRVSMVVRRVVISLSPGWGGREGCGQLVKACGVLCAQVWWIGKEQSVLVVCWSVAARRWWCCSERLEVRLRCGSSRVSPSLDHVSVVD